MSNNINSKVKEATKWSSIAEVISKLFSPIVSMVLARLLTPEAFGIVTTLTMIITFAEIFTDAGFQKYLIQHQFIDDDDKNHCTNVAFWSNLVMSLVIWGIVSMFSDSIAVLVGNPGLGDVLVISCASIPLSAFSSIQMALYKRELDFKTLFKVRLAGIMVPIIVTVPLALILKSYWALVLGNLTLNIINAILLTWYSKWKPQLYYSFTKLKEMFSFTFWSMVEAICIWLTHYVDVFIVGTMLSQYYLGLYKTSSTLVGQIMGIVMTVTTPILFSALSRLQEDDISFQNLFFRFQKTVGLLIIPMGVGLFLFSDLATEIILGNQWLEASSFVGLWALTSSITIVLSHYASEVYRAKGRPKLSVLVQVLHIIVLWPVVFISAQYGFETLYISRSLVRFELILVNLIVLRLAIGISPIKMLINVLPSIIAAIIMVIIFYMLPETNTIYIQFAYMGICALAYVAIIFLFRDERSIILNLKTLILRK